MDYLNIIAILTGPLAAILISRYLDKRKAIRQEKISIFKNLLAHQYHSVPNPLFFEALNLVQVVFYEQKDILAHHEALVGHLRQRHRYEGDDENGMDLSEQMYEISFLNLLKAMAGHLGFSGLRQTDMKNVVFSSEELYDYEIKNEFLETLNEFLRNEIDKKGLEEY